MFSQSTPLQTELQPPLTVLAAPLNMLKGIWLNLTVFFPKVSAHGGCIVATEGLRGQQS